MMRRFNPYIGKRTVDGDKNPCDPGCPKRSATCHGTCPEYTSWQKKLQDFIAAQENVRNGADASFEGLRKNKRMRALKKYGY